MKLKVMTYNICGGNNFDTRKGVMNFDKTVETIGGFAPDICGLNEVDKFRARSGYICESEVAGKALSMYDVFAPAIQFGNALYGNALLSKFKVESYEVIPVPDPEDKSENTYYETRGILKALLDCRGKTVEVLVTHFGLARAERAESVKLLVKLIKERKHPLILMGDFNLKPEDPMLKPISELLHDTADGYEIDHTWPSIDGINSDPFQKIDYMFVSDEFTVDNVEIPATTTSDHLPYISYLTLK